MTDHEDEYDFTLDDSELHIQDTPDPKTTGSKATGAKSAEFRHDTEEARENALKQELENVRKVNQALEGVIESLEKAKSNMGSVSHTVKSASTLLNTWTRILSQTEHNQRLILNPQWQGATQDLLDTENDASRRQHEAQRRQIEEQQRREAAQRKAEDDERRKAEAAAKAPRGTRGRGRATGRTTPGASTSSTSGSGYVGVGGQGGRGTTRGSTSGTTRTGSQVGRTTRGRGRGTNGS